MEAIAGILMAAVVLQAVIQVIKTWVPEGAKTPSWLWQVVGAALGVGVCLAGHLDLLESGGLWLDVPYVGSVLTGLVISQGASFVHDIWKNIKAGAVVEAVPEVTIQKTEPPSDPVNPEK